MEDLKMTKTNLTPKELYIIEAIISNEMGGNNYHLPLFTESYDRANGGECWASSIENNGAKNGEKVTGKSISGVVASLNKKGFVISRGKEPDATCEVTSAGWEAYQKDMIILESIN
jgi:hypothetical protein